MTRKDISTQWDRDNRNAINDNFKNLFDDFNNVVEIVSEKAYGDVIEAAKLNWKEPVNSYSDLPSEASEGDTRFDKETGRVYRFNGSEWIEIQQIDASAINEVDNRLTSQLAQNEKDIVSVYDKTNREVVSRKSRKPMITIIDDDGRTDVLNKWEPILKSKSFKMDIAVITGWVGSTNYMTWEELERLKHEYNVDLVNHTHTHERLGDLTEEEIVYQMQNSTDILKSRGHTYDVMVYPYGSNSDLSRKITRDYCRVGIYTMGGVAKPPLETFKLPRYSLLPSSGEMDTVETYTALIDEAIADNGWIIFMTHSQYDSFDATKIEQVIDYANANGVDWVHAKEGLEKIGNIIDVGDYPARAQDAEYTVMDADGVWHSRSNPVHYRSISTRHSFSIDTPISDFSPGTTLSVITNSDADSFPDGEGGILETVRGSSTVDIFSFQKYYITKDNRIYKRTWDDSTSSWSKFELISGISEIGSTNSYTPSSLPEDFPPNRITHTEINSSHPDLVDFPEGDSGVLMTNRLFTSSKRLCFQEYHVYGTGNLYRRACDWTDWRDWVLVAGTAPA